MDRSTKLLYAAKVMKKKVNSMGKKRTIGQLLNVDHKNLVRLKEVFETSLSLHLVVELAYGEELFHRLSKVSVYTEKTVLYYFRQIVDGIKYLHEYEIIHRNLKPENVLLSTRDNDAIVKITDYCPHLFTTEDLDMELVCYTTTFCAPEILISRRYDKSIDLWALGVLLYIMLCGNSPFKSKTGSDLYRAILHNDIDFEFGHWKSISLNAQDVVKRLLMPDPKSRIITPYLINHSWFIELNENEQHFDSVKTNLEHFNKQRAANYFSIEEEKEDWFISEYAQLPRRSSESILTKPHDDVKVIKIDDKGNKQNNVGSSNQHELTDGILVGNDDNHMKELLEL
ncbi:Calcium/calmodulin-dependent protein kinase type IV [Schistosoma japonicum]|nr:Calcium/calmodulin-dependent protein kinase type IV [Schistosoma japonicum]KAH8858434.1 Calcium/calmodulin-dependent protein kinase type IV [Schistosoma japonicum]KAH8858435.1 Calcium/calmodulin-dependent protein kinase type IV [Schistosoma japonicum]